MFRQQKAELSATWVQVISTNDVILQYLNIQIKSNGKCKLNIKGLFGLVGKHLREVTFSEK